MRNNLIFKIRQRILKVFKNENIEDNNDQLDFVGDFDESLKLDEISTDELIFCIIPFLNAFPNKKENLVEYLKFLLNINIFEENYEKIDNCQLNDKNNYLLENLIENYTPNGKSEYSSSVYKKGTTEISCNSDNNSYEFDPIKTLDNFLNNVYERSDCIYLYGQIKNFNYDYIDWEDRNFNINILKYTFYKSLLAIKSIQNQETVYKFKDKEISNDKMMNACKMYECGHFDQLFDTRDNLLTRRLKPTKTMDELTRIAIEDMNDRENQRIEREKFKKQDLEEKNDSKVQEELDDLKEENRRFSGNTKNIG